MFTVLLKKGEQNSQAFMRYIPRDLHNIIEAPEAIVLGVANDNDVSAGVLVSKVVGDWVEILWLYVDDEFRNKGGGTLLLSDLLSCVDSESDITGVFSQFPAQDNKALENLFAKNGFELEDGENNLYSLKAADLHNNRFWQKEQGGSENADTLDNVIDVKLKEFEVKLSLAGVSVALDFPIKWREYDGKLSSVYIKNNEVRGVLLFKKLDNELLLSYAYVTPEEKTALPAMLYKSGRIIIDTLPADTSISLAAITDASAKLMGKLFENSQPQQTRCAVYHINQSETEEGSLS
ncbi:MAG: GNAT family N-acetyltransferase [Oscillospiraceae bacterium]|nr:GNAT family N-acetyltransferase [Oscillospiraceae bacterium]